ncbi:hypothetical protein DENSPDRAFT_883975 [Dentipellis sp. KUC8613]|nr:hypothetical protein DENSPDRAFT_883975 [Dentipellis sp. KUC8613]
MPTLESLDLSSVVPPLPLGSTSYTMHAPAATLPNLRKFSLSDHALKCAVAINHICIPSTAGQEVACTGDNNSERSSEVMIPWFTSVLGDSPPVRVLQIEDWTDGFSISWDSFRANDDDSEDECQCNFYFHDSVDRSITQLKAFCDALPLENLEKLSCEFSEDSSWSLPDWSAFFSGCRSLRHLRVAHTYPIGLRDASNNRLEEHAGRLYPFLKTLTFVYMNLESRPDSEELCRNLAPSQKISLKDCVVDEAAVNMLREEGIVVVVEDEVSSDEGSESDALSGANASG